MSMHYMKDVFEGKVSEHAHNKFVRYSKGNFVGPLINIKISKANVKVSASFHFVDELLMMVAKVLGDKVVHVEGTLVWNEDLSVELAKLGIKYSKVSKSRGIFKYSLENDVNIKDFVQEAIKYNVLVKIKEEEVSLVTKNAFIKPNKEFGPDFCKAVFPIEMADEILSEFAFDVKGEKLKDIRITHAFTIDDIILPKDAPDFETARKEAKRVGLAKRVVLINNSETKESEVKLNV